jgi:hypothetical protein
MYPRDAILPAHGPWQFKHIHGGSAKLQPAARTMSRQRSSSSMLADAEPLMMSIYRKGGHVLMLVSPISGMLIKFLGEIFLDNTDLLTMLQDTFKATKVLAIAQANIDKWACLLIATGGALNPDKFDWNNHVCHVFLASHFFL